MVVILNVQCQLNKYITVVKILHELIESEPKAIIKGKDGQLNLNKQQNYR